MDFNLFFSSTNIRIKYHLGLRIVTNFIRLKLGIFHNYFISNQLMKFVGRLDRITYMYILQIIKKSSNKIFWGGRIRTSEWRDQNPLPYHLATPH